MPHNVLKKVTKDSAVIEAFGNKKIKGLKSHKNEDGDNLNEV